jgi:hypothetical protein
MVAVFAAIQQTARGQEGATRDPSRHSGNFVKSKLNQVRGREVGRDCETLVECNAAETLKSG